MWSQKEIYVYDNRLTQSASSASPPSVKLELPVPKPYGASMPPNPTDDTRSASSWQQQFKARRAWTRKVFEDCSKMANDTQERYCEIDVMLGCLDAAVANLESVIKGLEPKYAELKKWLPEAQAEYGALTTGWEQSLSLARSVPISAAMVRFMTGRDISGTKGRPPRQATLEDLVELETARKAGRLAPAHLRKFNGRIADLDKLAARLFQDAEELFREFEAMVGRSPVSHSGEAPQLLQDIEALVKKIETDCDLTLELSNSARDALQASKIAANHTERLLPTIRKRALDMGEMARYATQARNRLAVEVVEITRNITGLTAPSNSVKSQINSFNQEDELATFDYLRLIQQLPYMYATFMAEAIQRREWFDKVRQDSSVLANEMAAFQDEEIKRRRRWLKSVGETYGPAALLVESRVPGLEVNLLGEDEQWPAVTRSELEDFHNHLQTQGFDVEMVGDIGRMITELSSPTRQQSRRMKAFKNGSIHEVAIGRSGLLIRGDDDLLRSLQEDKSKLESKLKTAESRVRRLEDLLHWQTQASRPNLGNLFQLPSQQLADRNDSTMSGNSHRVSEDRRRSTEGNDGVLQRIQQLEAELNAEKERSAMLEKDLNTRETLHNEMKSQIVEVNSTKKDLMENMEALKREFIEERRSLNDEIKGLRTRLEETEEEMGIYGDSGETEKASYNEKVLMLELEVERLVKDRQDETLELKGQVDVLRERTRVQREQMEQQERQLRSAEEESKSLIKKVDSLTERADMQLKPLRALWEQLSQDDMPNEAADLVEGVIAIVVNMLSKAHGQEEDVALLRMELDAAQTTTKDFAVELASTKEKLSKEELASVHLRETVAEKKVKVAALEDELASRQSRVEALEEEVRHFRLKLQDSQEKLSETTLRLGSRTERAMDLTQRLYSRNERLARLLERLGFAMTRLGSSTVIQKVPRSERTQSIAESELVSSLRRSGTLSNRPATDSTDMESLHWMNDTDAEAERTNYEAFMGSLGSFDTDAFSEAIYRRVKDVEHLARKLQRDARAYREKAHTLQKEAHDKIAFKHFKEGDLALFLPTRNQTTGAWAAFNVGSPHYFLREQEVHRLHSREWLVARISRIQERVVDLSKSLQHQVTASRKGATDETDSLNDEENDNPFDLSDGLRWYLIDAIEDKPGAPSTPGLAKSTVAANNIEVMGDMHTHGRLGGKGPAGRGGVPSGIEGVSKTLSKSLESRRSSTGSKKAPTFAIGVARGRDSALASETNSLRAVPADTPAATSPTQQHASLQSISPQGFEQTAELGNKAGADSSLDQPSPLPGQPTSEVRNDMDVLAGP